MKITILISLVGVTVCLPSGPKFKMTGLKHKRQSSSDEDYYNEEDASKEELHYHYSDDDSSESDGSSDYSNESSGYKPNYNNYYNTPRYNNQQGPPSVLHQGSRFAGFAPAPVKESASVAAERQRQLFSFGPHLAHIAAAQPVRPIPGGYSSPWIPIFVPAVHNPGVHG